MSIEEERRQVRNIFRGDFVRGEQGIWHEKRNKSCMLLHDISEAARKETRNAFRIEEDEEILFVRDTSFWMTRDQGLVITDEAIYCVPDNEKPDARIYLPWHVIYEIYYKELCLHFCYEEEGERDKIRIHLDFFFQYYNNDETASLGSKCAALFTRMAKSVSQRKNPVDANYDKAIDLYNEKRYQESLDLLLQTKVQYGEDANWIQALIVRNAAELSDGNLAHYCEDAFNIYPPDTSAYWECQYHWIGSRKPDKKSRGELFWGYKNCGDLESPIIPGLKFKEEFKSLVEISDLVILEDILELPYNERKVIVPVKTYENLENLDQESLFVLNLDYMPNNIAFPVGHPVANELYIGHPYLPNRYIPFENYELEFIEDKIREFCQIAQCLGATEISIEALNATGKDNRYSKESNMNGEVKFLASANATMEKSASSRLIDSISQAINLHQKFTPTAAPKLPDNLVWYPNEPSWQRLYEQRMSGSLSEHEERIETRKNRVLESSQMTTMHGEFKNLMLQAKGSWNEKLDATFEVQENAILSIHVTFAPLSQLRGNAPAEHASGNNSAPALHRSGSEEEYAQELREMLAEGEISPRERRLLDRLREKLGISVERAQEIEQSLAQPALTAEEQEYLDEYRDCIVEGGDLSDRERRLLDKIRISLNISKERAEEIERLA